MIGESWVWHPIATLFNQLRNNLQVLCSVDGKTSSLDRHPWFRVACVEFKFQLSNKEYFTTLLIKYKKEAWRVDKT